MTTKVGKKFLLFRTTKEIWEAACETYSSSENSSELFEIETRLYDYNKEKQDLLNILTLTHCWLQWIYMELILGSAWMILPCIKNYWTKNDHQILLGLNKDLDEVRRRIMRTKPLLIIREGFAKVQREESRKKLMMIDNHTT